jgi:hypothetical protein
MQNNIEFIKIYFTEEKIESLFFIFLGFIAISLAFIFWFIIKYSFYTGFAYPLLIIGIIQLTVGTTVFFRTESDIKRVEHMIQNESELIGQKELPRMEIVMKNFVIYKWIEIVLILLGIFLYFHFRTSTQVFWKGLGLGLLIQSGIMLSLDFVAEKRGQIYANELKIVSVL